MTDARGRRSRQLRRAHRLTLLACRWYKLFENQDNRNPWQFGIHPGLGKSRIVPTHHGNAPTSVIVAGKPHKIRLNAYINSSDVGWGQGRRCSYGLPARFVRGQTINAVLPADG